MYRISLCIIFKLQKRRERFMCRDDIKFTLFCSWSLSCHTAQHCHPPPFWAGVCIAAAAAFHLLAGGFCAQSVGVVARKAPPPTYYSSARCSESQYELTKWSDTTRGGGAHIERWTWQVFCILIIQILTNYVKVLTM